MPLAPPPDKYQLLKEEYYRIRDEYRQSRATIDNYDRELRKRTGELHKANHYINHLQHESQRSKDFINDLQNLINIHQELGAAEDTLDRGSTAHHPSPSTRKPQDAQATSPAPGHHSKQDRTLKIKQQVAPSPPKDKYQFLKEEYYRTRDEFEDYDHELRTWTNEEMNRLQHESERSKDFISDLQNLINVHQELDSKTLSGVSSPQVFSTKADTLSISEVGKKVTVLNEEIFQAAAALGEALIHKRYEVSQTDLDAAAAESHYMIGEKMTKILIAHAQKPKPEVNLLLVQVVLQIFMVRFCASKIQSWYPGNPAIGEFLSAIYSEIRSSRKHRINSRTKFCLTYNTF